MKKNEKTNPNPEVSEMKDAILLQLQEPQALEKLYQSNKSIFKKSFHLLYPEIKENAIAAFWLARIQNEKADISWGSTKDILFLVIAIFLAGLLVKIPEWMGLETDYFLQRNIAFVILPFVAAYLAWKEKIKTSYALVAVALFLFSAIYINYLPTNENSDTLLLACIHLPLFLWAIAGFMFVGNQFNDYKKRISFLRFNGDLLVMIAIIAACGALLIAVTFGLFELIEINIQTALNHYILVWGLPAIPIVGTFLVRTNPQLVNKISPIIAKIFTPLVLVTLVIYLFAIVYTGKDPYNDRNFLLIFNVLLIGVMAIILFSVAENSKNVANKIGTLLLFCLALVTIILNGIALSAIIFRITEWGITPNRLAVLGANLLILTNLLIVSYQLLKSIKNTNRIENVEKSIASFIPFYVIWAVVVTFVFPLIFNFR